MTDKQTLQQAIEKWGQISIEYYDGAPSCGIPESVFVAPEWAIAYADRIICQLLAKIDDVRTAVYCKKFQEACGDQHGVIARLQNQIDAALDLNQKLEG